MAAIAMSDSKGGDSCAVVGEGSDRGIRRLASRAKRGFRERENTRQGPDMHTGIGGAGQNEIRGGIDDERGHRLQMRGRRCN